MMKKAGIRERIGNEPVKVSSEELRAARKEAARDAKRHGFMLMQHIAAFLVLMTVTGALMSLMLMIAGGVMSTVNFDGVDPSGTYAAMIVTFAFMTAFLVHFYVVVAPYRRTLNLIRKWSDGRRRKEVKDTMKVVKVNGRK